MAELWAVPFWEREDESLSSEYVEWHLTLIQDGPVLCQHQGGRREAPTRVSKDEPDMWEQWQCYECLLALATRAKTAEAHVAELERVVRGIHDRVDENIHAHERQGVPMPPGPAQLLYAIRDDARTALKREAGKTT